MLLHGCRQLHSPGKTEDVFEDIVEEIEERSDTSNYKVKSPLAKGKNKELIGIKKVELVGKIMKKIVALRSKRYRYLTDYGCVEKKGQNELCDQARDKIPRLQKEHEE